MTKWKRWIGALLTLALICSFVGCGLFGVTESQGDDTAGDDTQASDTAADPAQPSDPNAPTVFKKSDVKLFKLVYAADLGKEALAEAQRLATRISETCGVTLLVTDDVVVSEDEQRREWEHEILIGFTNREESAAFVKDLRQGDYGYGYLNGKIVIGAGSDAKVRNAILMFVEEVISEHSSEDIFYRSDWGQLEREDYPIERLTLNGKSIKDYQIVYAAASELFEREMAGRLQSMIFEQTGYVLTIRSDGEVDAIEQAILIGKTKFFADLQVLSENEGCVLGNGANVIAYGDDVQGVVNASKLLTDILLDETSTERVREITVGAARKSTGSEAFSVMTHNLTAGNVTEARIERAMALIYQYMPDTLGVQEADAQWMSALRERLSAYYAIVGEGNEGDTRGEHTAILYSKAKYKLLDSGTKWLTDTPDQASRLPGANDYSIFTWALLEDRETGVRYLHVNTRLDCDAVRLAQVKYLMQFLKEYNDVAVVLTGDMNATAETAEMGCLREQGFATKQDFGELEHLPHYGRGNRVVDWILVTRDCMALTSYITDDNYSNGDFASDHCSYYAEFTLSYPADGTLDHGWKGLEDNVKPDGILQETEDPEGGEFGELIRPRL